MNAAIHLIGLCLVGQAAAQPQKALSAAEVIDRWEAGVKLVESYDLRIEAAGTTFNYNKDGVSKILTKSEAPPPSISHSRIYRSNDKRRGEFGGDGDVHYRTTMIYAGREWFVFSNTGEQVVIKKSIEVFGSNEYEDYESIDRTMFGDGDRIAISRTHQPRLMPSMVGPTSSTSRLATVPNGTMFIFASGSIRTRISSR